MQTSETYMIGWRARVYQQYDSALSVTCHTNRGNSGTRRSPARYARDPIRYERGMTKLLKATVLDTGR
jgi:hypothetical protein